MSTVYCIDTSAWIHAADTYLLGDARFAGFWAWMDSMVANGRLVSPEEVLVELDADAEVGPWVKSKKDQIIKPQDPPVQVEFARIDGTYPKLTRKGKPMAKNQADAWVVAIAKLNGWTVVSQENRKLNAKERCLPGVCELEGVPHLNFVELLRKEQS